MEVKEFIAICKEVFPKCVFEGSRSNKNPCLMVSTSKFGPYVARLWDNKCCAWEKSEVITDKEDYNLEELKLKLEKVKLSYRL